MNWSSHLTQLSGKEKKIVNGSSIIVSLACSAGVLLGRVDVKRLANSTDYVWFGVRVDVGGRGRGKSNIQCPTPFPPLLCDRHISTTPSPPSFGTNLFLLPSHNFHQDNTEHSLACSGRYHVFCYPSVNDIQVQPAFTRKYPNILH